MDRETVLREVRDRLEELAAEEILAGVFSSWLSRSLDAVIDILERGNPMNDQLDRALTPEAFDWRSCDGCGEPLAGVPFFREGNPVVVAYHLRCEDAYHARLFPDAADAA